MRSAIEGRSCVARQLSQHSERQYDVFAGEPELAALKGRTEALKILNNAFYGQLYAVFSPLYHYASAKNITTLGQEFTKLMLARMRELGFEAIAGDTDSTYVKVPSEMFNKESAKALGMELTGFVSKHILAKYGVHFVGSFDFKDLLSDMALFKKKFYARLISGKPVTALEIKGYTRGTTPEIQRDLQRKVFETMFAGGDVKAMITDERARFFDAKDHTGFLTWMRPHSNEGTTAQVRAKKALEAAGIVVQRSEQVGFLILGSGKKQKRLIAHMLPDSRVEWMWHGDETLHLETEFLTPEEAERQWDQTVKKLDGVE